MSRKAKKRNPPNTKKKVKKKPRRRKKKSKPKTKIQRKITRLKKEKKKEAKIRKTKKKKDYRDRRGIVLYQYQHNKLKEYKKNLTKTFKDIKTETCTSSVLTQVKNIIISILDYLKELTTFYINEKVENFEDYFSGGLIDINKGRKTKLSLLYAV